MKRLLLALVTLGVVAAATAAGAGAYGGGAAHDMWQVGLSANCNDPAVCGDELGGFWGWAEFDRAGQQTWGDAEFAGCGHMVGGGGPGTAGAGHVSIEIDSWKIGPGSAGPDTFFATGTETDFHPGGVRDVFAFTDADTGIPAVPGHYSTADLFGSKMPGVAYEIQVAYRPAK